jgi:predicted NACHT family NTPase
MERFSQPATAGQLWIMGASGMGKTTALVELAAELVQRAKADDQAPIPVLIHASAAAGNRFDGFTWLVEVLQHKYGVAPKLGYRWLMEGTVLPLLDGWDEVSPQTQATLGPWIQDWWRQGKPMVVVGDAGDRSIPRMATLLH